MTSKEALTAIGTTQPEYLKGGRHTYETAIAKLKGSISLKKSAAKTIGYLSLTNEQIFYIGSLVGADADALDLVIEAADLQVEEAVA